MSTCACPDPTTYEDADGIERCWECGDTAAPMSTPRPTEADVEARRRAVLADLGVCEFRELVTDASMCRCGLPAVNHDTFAEQIVMGDHPHVSDLLNAYAILAARDAEHQRPTRKDIEAEIAARIATALQQAASEHEAEVENLVNNWRTHEERGNIQRTRAEAAEHDRDEARRELADLRAKVTEMRAGIWRLGESIHGDEGVEHVEGCEGEPTCFACILAALRALLPTEDDQQ